MSETKRKTRDTILTKLPDGSADSVLEVLNNLRNEYGEGFSEVFRTITADNGSEFARLHEIESLSVTQVYFTHPYSAFERGTNQRHNGLVLCLSLKVVPSMITVTAILSGLKIGATRCLGNF